MSVMTQTISDGIVVAKPPQDPAHASGIRRVERALRESLGDEVVISSQLPLISGPTSVPEPDVAVLAGKLEDYEIEHPTDANLVIEIADLSLAQDRLTKSRIYAHAGIPQFWIVNLREARIEIHRRPRRGRYTTASTARRGRRVRLVAFPDVAIAVDDLLPTSCR